MVVVFFFFFFLSFFLFLFRVCVCVCKKKGKKEHLSKRVEPLLTTDRTQNLAGCARGRDHMVGTEPGKGGGRRTVRRGGGWGGGWVVNQKGQYQLAGQLQIACGNEDLSALVVIETRRNTLLRPSTRNAK